jgi:hypothetical protein
MLLRGFQSLRTCLADAFARFSIVTHLPTKDALLQAAEQDYGEKLEHVRCHLVVPKGSRFIRALGYRARLLEMGVMELTEIELPDHELVILNRVLKTASAEMSWKEEQGSAFDKWQNAGSYLLRHPENKWIEVGMSQNPHQSLVCKRLSMKEWHIITIKSQKTSVSAKITYFW